MKLIVEQRQRYAKMRAHTATHLLHAELSKIFNATKQAGSLVDEDYLRFDFNADRLLTPEEIHDIEKNINQIIYDSCVVEISEMPMEEARKLGAKAFFEDKYGDMVRVIKVFNHDNGMISVELCGGTHVSNTKEIGCFAITGQEAVASGIKRITAVTGPKVVLRIHELQDILDATIEKLGIKTHTQLVDKLEKTLKEYDEMNSLVKSMESKMIVDALQSENTKSDKHFQKIIQISSDINFKNVLTAIKGMFKDENVLIFNNQGNFLLLTKKGTSANALAQKLGLKGGGNDHIVQGRDDKILSIVS